LPGRIMPLHNSRGLSFVAAALLSCSLPQFAMAQAPEVALSEEQAAHLAEMKAAAADIDTIVDPRGYMAAYQDIVAYAQTIYPPDHPEVVALEGEVDFGYFMLGQLDALAPRLLRAQAIFSAAGPQYRQNYIETVNNLGVIHEALGESELGMSFQR